MFISAMNLKVYNDPPGDHLSLATKEVHRYTSQSLTEENHESSMLLFVRVCAAAGLYSTCVHIWCYT